MINYVHAIFIKLEIQSTTDRLEHQPWEKTGVGHSPLLSDARDPRPGCLEDSI